MLPLRWRGASRRPGSEQCDDHDRDAETHAERGNKIDELFIRRSRWSPSHPPIRDARMPSTTTMAPNIRLADPRGSRGLARQTSASRPGCRRGRTFRLPCPMSRSRMPGCAQTTLEGFRAREFPSASRTGRALVPGRTTPRARAGSQELPRYKKGNRQPSAGAELSSQQVASRRCLLGSPDKKYRNAAAPVFGEKIGDEGWSDGDERTPRRFLPGCGGRAVASRCG